MAGINITKKDTLLQTILDDVQEILIMELKNEQGKDIAINSAADIATQITDVTELPVIEDSIEVDLGSIDVAYTKITDGSVVASKFTKGDPSCTMNIASIDSNANKFFADTVGKAAEMILDNSEYTLMGYSGKVVVKNCLIIMRSADKKSVVVFPRCKVSAGFKPTGGGDANTGYWEVQFIPLMNAEGAQFYLTDGSEAGE